MTLEKPTPRTDKFGKQPVPECIHELSRTNPVAYDAVAKCFAESCEFARQLERELAESTRELGEAVPYSDIHAAIKHIHENADSFKKFGGWAVDESRCRELCAMYLGEWITSWEMKKRINELDAATGRRE